MQTGENCLHRTMEKGEIYFQGSTLRCNLSGCEVVQYAADHSIRMTKEQRELREITLKAKKCLMMTPPDVHQLSENLIKTIKAKKILDIGVYTGCSALSAALATADDGKVYALDINEEFTNIGKPFWKMARVDHKIELIIGPALETLGNFVDKGESGTFDFAFLDADKENYDKYYELCLKLLRPGGIIAIDDTFFLGLVFDEKNEDSRAKSIRKLNDKLKDDNRIGISCLTIGDGLTLCFKK